MATGSNWVERGGKREFSSITQSCPMIESGFLWDVQLEAIRVWTKVQVCDQQLKGELEGSLVTGIKILIYKFLSSPIVLFLKWEFVILVGNESDDFIGMDV